MEEHTYRECGLYLIKDSYFSDFPSDLHMQNKGESRPHYFAVRAENGIYWMVPLSSKVEKYRAKIEQAKRTHGDSLFYHIGRIKGDDRVFLVGNVIPVTEHYIKKAFTVKGVPYIVKNKTDIKKIKSKVRRYLVLVKQGKLKPYVDILEIEKQLIAKDLV